MRLLHDGSGLRAIGFRLGGTGTPRPRLYRLPNPDHRGAACRTRGDAVKGMAQIFFAGGGLIVPAKTPYERELLFQHVEAYTQRYGRVGLTLNRRQWNVSSGAEQRPCAVCKRQVTGIVYSRTDRMVCAQCARRELR